LKALLLSQDSLLPATAGGLAAPSPTIPAIPKACQKDAFMAALPTPL
jgi:hypothetical protein